MTNWSKRIIVFIVIVLTCGWLGKIVDLILTGQPEGHSLGLLIWLIMPFIASILLALVKKSDNKELGLKPRLKGNCKWYFVSFVTFPSIAIVTIGLGLITRSIDSTRFEIREFIASIFTWFLYNFFRAIFEETAWRGFLQERLIYLKLNDWLIYFITVMVWATWHIPYYLFFYEGNSAEMIVSCFIILFSWGILFAEIYRVTRTIWPCVLLHATSNAIQYTMTENYLVFNEKRQFIFSPTGSILACALSIILGLMIRKYRLSRKNI
ncbi:MAG: CPBP family intramembrane glutamic endopeptidase [Velocimicrobium sp.]